MSSPHQHSLREELVQASAYSSASRIDAHKARRPPHVYGTLAIDKLLFGTLAEGTLPLLQVGGVLLNEPYDRLDASHLLCRLHSAMAL